MAGTEVMTIADLNEMEARVDIGEMDVVLIKVGQRARLEVDAFKDRKFTGLVTDIANSAKGAAAAASQDATKFEVAIRVSEKENFRPGMSVNTEIETRYRTNALVVPIAAVTTRPPKPPSSGTNAPSSGTTNTMVSTNRTSETNDVPSAKKSKETAKPIEVVFVVDGDKVKQVPVKIGISDEDYYEIVEGLTEGQEIVTGNYKAVNKELEDGKKIIKGFGGKGGEKEKK
jgi:HlyD family secretion protein